MGRGFTLHTVVPAPHHTLAKRKGFAPQISGRRDNEWLQITTVTTKRPINHTQFTKPDLVPASAPKPGDSPRPGSKAQESAAPGQGQGTAPRHRDGTRGTKQLKRRAAPCMIHSKASQPDCLDFLFDGVPRDCLTAADSFPSARQMKQCGYRKLVVRMGGMGRTEWAQPGPMIHTALYRWTQQRHGSEACAAARDSAEYHSTIS